MTDATFRPANGPPNVQPINVTANGNAGVGAQGSTPDVTLPGTNVEYRTNEIRIYNGANPITFSFVGVSGEESPGVTLGANVIEKLTVTGVSKIRFRVPAAGVVPAPATCMVIPQVYSAPADVVGHLADLSELGAPDPAGA